MFKKLGVFFMAVVLASSLTGCGNANFSGKSITIDLYPDTAPITVANFLKLVDEGLYDGTIFHRVIPDFMIQGGGETADGKGKDVESIKGEFSSNGVENDLKHTKGVISMARTNDKDSASSQFFICVADAAHLDGEYAAFGKVIEGQNVADEISKMKSDASDRPNKNVIIKNIQRKEPNSNTVIINFE